MEIPAANLVNKYIATQGPLPHTCAQFWQVVWDQKLSLIVMLTTLTERGRVSGLISNSNVCMSQCVLQNMNLRAGKGLKCHLVQPLHDSEISCKELVMDTSNEWKLSTTDPSLTFLPQAEEWSGSPSHAWLRSIISSQKAVPLISPALGPLHWLCPHPTQDKFLVLRRAVWGPGSQWW